MIVKLNDVRISFPELWEATQYQGTGPYSYKASFLFQRDGENHNAVKTAIKAVANETFKGKAVSVLESVKDNSQKCCLYSGDTKVYDGYQGMMVLSATRAQDAGQPLVLGSGPDRKGVLNEKQRSMIYAGCYVNASVDIWAQDNKWGKGIRAQLRGVQFLRDGDSFTAGAPLDADEFEGIEAPIEDDLA